MLWWTIRKLNSRDQNARLVAVRLISANPSSKAEEALIALLRKSDDRDLRYAAVEALSTRGGRKTIDALLEFARREGDGGLSGAACDALVRLGWHKVLASRLANQNNLTRLLSVDGDIPVLNKAGQFGNEATRKAVAHILNTVVQRDVAKVAERQRTNSYGDGGTSAIRQIVSIGPAAFEPLCDLLRPGGSIYERKVVREVLEDLADSRAAKPLVDCWAAAGFPKPPDEPNLSKLDTKAVIAALSPYVGSDAALRLLDKFDWEPHTPEQSARIAMLRGNWEALLSLGPEGKVVLDTYIEGVISGTRKVGFTWRDLAKCLAEHGDNRAVRLAAPHLLESDAKDAAECLALMDSAEAVDALISAFPKIVGLNARPVAARALCRWGKLRGFWNQDYRAVFSWILELFNDLENTRYVDSEQPAPIYAELLERGIDTFARSFDTTFLLSAVKVPDRTAIISAWDKEMQGYHVAEEIRIDCSCIRELAKQELLLRGNTIST